MANSAGARVHALMIAATAKMARRATVLIHANGSRLHSPAASARVATNEVERLPDLPQERDRARDDCGHDFELVSGRPAEPHDRQQQRNQQNGDHSGTPATRAARCVSLPLCKLLGALGSAHELLEALIRNLRPWIERARRIDVFDLATFELLQHVVPSRMSRRRDASTNAMSRFVSNTRPSITRSARRQPTPQVVGDHKPSMLNITRGAEQPIAQQALHLHVVISQRHPGGRNHGNQYQPEHNANAVNCEPVLQQHGDGGQRQHSPHDLRDQADRPGPQLVHRHQAEREHDEQRSCICV